MKNLIKKLIPNYALSLFHLVTAYASAIYYKFPSRRLIVIGVTGTKGKTSTINYIWSVLSSSGIKTGIISTANVRIGDKEILNPFHMTMPGRFKIQGFLREMVDSRCEVAIVETTSQGIAQYRHKGIDYDVAVFTNLSPEHIDAHKTFENYKMAKGKLFDSLSKSKTKYFRGSKFKKTIIANKDSEYAEYYLGFKADSKIGYSINSDSLYKATHIVQQSDQVLFKLNDLDFELSIPGLFNVYNSLPAIIIGDILGVANNEIQKGVKNLKLIPGRMEEIDEGQKFKVYVDYAHEKLSMTYVVETGRNMVKSSGRVIILLGAEGGGRDKSKRAIMGEIVGKYADVVIASNVDPYEDDPTPIVEDIAKASEKEGKVRGENLFVIEDRREGIAKAISIAQENDVVIITGKGAEQSMIIDGKSIYWDDRVVTREELQKLRSTK